MRRRSEPRLIVSCWASGIRPRKIRPRSSRPRARRDTAPQTEPRPNTIATKSGRRDWNGSCVGRALGDAATEPHRAGPGRHASLSKPHATSCCIGIGSTSSRSTARPVPRSAERSRLTLSPLHSGADIKGAQTVRFRLNNSPTRLVSAVAIIYRRAAGVGCFWLLSNPSRQ
jgi:hypothetical protein